MRNISLVEVRSEIAAGTRGASLGVDAVKVASLDKKSDFFSKFDPIRVPDANSYLWEGNKFPHAKYIDGVFEVVSGVFETIKTLRREKKFPIILAGDHATAAGTIMGIKAADPDKRLGVVWIDAHADLHTPYTTPSGNMHGMPLAMCIGTDNKECQINEPEAEALTYWEKIKNIGGKKPKILPEDIIYIAMRDTEEAEEYLIKKHNIRNFPIDEIRTEGIGNISRKALNALSPCEQIYISFDVD